jgi:hypothetical protein
MLCVAQEVAEGSLEVEVAWRQFEVAIAAYCNTPPPPPSERLATLIEARLARSRQVMKNISG